MKTQRSTSASQRLIGPIAVFAGLCLAFVGVNARSAKKSQPPQASPEIQIRNYTNAFQVVGTETVGDDYVIMLKNVSQKAISAYSWSLGPSSRPTNIRDSDGAGTGQVISPGAIFRAEVPLIAFKHSAETTPSHQAIFNFIAVVFDDLSSEGFPERVKVIKDRRIGEKIQLKRVKRLLNEAGDAQDSEIPNRLDSLRARITALSNTPEEGQSDEIADGLLSAKRHTLVMLEHLMTEHGGIEMLSGPNGVEHARRILSGLMEQTDTWLSRY
ncbi:MAG TPA: hypothetical protein VN937_15750 [Blastocatellia bacterium]|nr:hypothetical protein [Blastocatellia bacterium]